MLLGPIDPEFATKKKKTYLCIYIYISKRAADILFFRYAIAAIYSKIGTNMNYQRVAKQWLNLTKTIFL